MIAIPFVEPATPDATPIDMLHRRHDGHITFCRKPRDGSKKFQTMFSVPASEVLEVFPQFIAPHVGEDAYVSTQGFWAHRDSWQLRTPSRIEPRLKCGFRKASQIRALTCASVDLDCYNKGLTSGYVLGNVHDWVQQGEIPPPSLFVDSGRGVWLLWMLRDDLHEHLPVRAFEEKVPTWNRIQRRLAAKFEPLGSDAKATDVSRVMRVPGSINTKSNTRVRYWVPLNHDAKPFVYTLDALAVMMGVRPTKFTEGVRRVVDSRNREKGIRGRQAQHVNRYRALLALIRQRVKIGRGHRECFLRELALTGSQIKNLKEPLEGMDIPEWEYMVRSIAEQGCDPPFINVTEDDDKSHDLDALIKRAAKPPRGWKMMSKYKLGQRLNVTEDEAVACGIPPAGADRSKDDCELRTRGERITARREMVKAFVQNQQRHDYPKVPTLAALADHVDRHGLPASLNTIRDDLEKLGIVNPRGHAKPKQIDDKPLWTHRHISG